MIFSNKEQYLLDAQEKITNQQDVEDQELRKQAIKVQVLREEAQANPIPGVLDFMYGAKDKQ